MTTLNVAMKIGQVRTSVDMPKIIDKQYAIKSKLYPETELTRIPGTEDYLQILLNDQIIHRIPQTEIEEDSLVDFVEIKAPGVVKIKREKPIAVKFQIPSQNYAWMPIYPFVVAAYLFVGLLVVCQIPQTLLKRGIVFPH